MPEELILLLPKVRAYFSGLYRYLKSKVVVFYSLQGFGKRPLCSWKFQVPCMTLYESVLVSACSDGSKVKKTGPYVSCSRDLVVLQLSCLIQIRGPGGDPGGGSTSVHLVWIKLKSSETEHSYFWPQLFMSYVLLCSVSIARRLTFTLWTVSLINKIGVVVYFLWLRIVKLSVWLSLKSLFCFPKIKSVTVALWWEWEELNEGSIVLMRQFSLDQNGGQTRYSASIEPSYSNKNKESITWDLVLIC